MAQVARASRKQTLWNKLMHRLDEIPLSSRLVSILLILLVVGLSVAAFATRQLTWQYMVDKTDRQLKTQAQLVIKSINVLSNGSNAGPTDYFLQIRDSDSNIMSTPLIPRRDGETTVPDLPESGSMEGIKMNVPTTVGSITVRRTDNNYSIVPMSNSSSPWRIMTYNWVNESDDSSGVLIIGLSLSDAMDTSGAISRYFLVVSFLILALAIAMGTLAISRTLAPLKRIEKTAAKIAAGDLSRRVPSSPINTEVGSLSASLNTMLSQIEKSFKEQENVTTKMKRFVSDASHELRTPLAAIHGYAELYRMQRDSPGALGRADMAIEHIESSSTRMAALVDDLLSLARLDEGRGADITADIRLDSMLAEVSEDLHALDPERPIALGTLVPKISTDESEPGTQHRMVLAQFMEKPMEKVTLIADSAKLRQVFTNIMGNIHRYTPANAPVEISLTVVTAAMSPQRLVQLGPDPAALGEFIRAVEVAESTKVGTKYAFVRFADRGPGVPPADLGQLFERFYTADASRAREKGGTGLGMAIAQSVVRAHSGFIAATQTPGGGLTINIGLPVAHTDMATPIVVPERIEHSSDPDELMPPPPTHMRN